MSRKARPASPGTQMTPEIEAMIRVDHAGEYGAVRIYEGQLAVLGARGSAASKAIEHMAAQEQRHLKTFDALVNERRVRPTALAPSNDSPRVPPAPRRMRRLSRPMAAG